MIDRLRKIFFIVALILVVVALIVEKAFESGFGLRGLTLLEMPLVFAIPFGTMIYVAVFGHFDRSGASTVLSSGMLLKLFFGGFLVAAEERYLQNKGLVLLILSSLLVTIIISFLHNLVPILLVSITDAVAGIVMGIIALLWAIWFLLKSIPAIV